MSLEHELKLVKDAVCKASEVINRIAQNGFKSNHHLDSKPIVEVSRSDIKKDYFAAFESHMDICPCESIAYTLARLATGKADSVISLTPKNEWDIAAGVILVTEAGGKVSSVSGETLMFNQSNTLVNGVIAASEPAFDKIYSITKKVSKD